MRRSLAATGTALFAAALVLGTAVPASAAEVTVVHEGEITEANPSDSYFLYLEPGDSVDISMTCPGGTLDPGVVVALGEEELEWFDDEGSMECGGYRDALGTFVAEVAGNYEFEATYAATSFGAYILTLTYPEHALTITSANAATVNVGSPLSLPITTDSLLPVTYSASGTLPPGVSLVDGVLTGTPTAPGTYVVDVTVSSGVLTAVQSITITVVATLPATGVDATVISLGAVALLAAGGILLYTRRRYSV